MANPAIATAITAEKTTCWRRKLPLPPDRSSQRAIPLQPNRTTTRVTSGIDHGGRRSHTAGFTLDHALEWAAKQVTDGPDYTGRMVGQGRANPRGSRAQSSSPLALSPLVSINYDIPQVSPDCLNFVLRLVSYGRVAWTFPLLC